GNTVPSCTGLRRHTTRSLAQRKPGHTLQCWIGQGSSKSPTSAAHEPSQVAVSFGDRRAEIPDLGSVAIVKDAVRVLCGPLASSRCWLAESSRILIRPQVDLW